jgi:cytidine deaminase
MNAAHMSTEIPEDRRAELIAAALRAREQAWAPYSDFQVGAALLTAAGEIITGCNVENASYGLTICAERTAVGNAVTNGERTFVALAVAASGGVTPCGACRQVLAEFCADLPILLINADQPDVIREVRLATLLPDTFRRAR